MSTAQADVRQYLLITGNYWAFTLTDGALRMLVLLHFHALGYAPLEVALLFLFYEVFGVVTNLVGGWLGASIGLNRTMQLGLGLQILALAMLLPATWLSVPWVMAAQALSGVAKDLNKMSAKAGVKLLLPAGEQARLYRWVALLTGSKNALKGAGFFAGGLLLGALGFQGAIGVMVGALASAWLAGLVWLRRDLGRAKHKPKFRQLLSKSAAINRLSAARLCLFAARDVWFVVALPVFLSTQLGWSHAAIGTYLATWVIGYGLVQAVAPQLQRWRLPDGRTALTYALPLASVPAALALWLPGNGDPTLPITLGLAGFGLLFALNSALHSYLIVAYAAEDGVSLDVGFYYMANALGRLLGTVLSGALYQVYGLGACLWASTVLITLAALASLRLPRHVAAAPVPASPIDGGD